MIPFGTNPYGGKEECCYCLSTEKLKEIWQTENDACSESNCSGCCKYAMLSRGTWLARSVVWAPYNLVGSILYSSAGISLLAGSALTALGGVLGAAATCGCCCGSSEGWCECFKATEFCAADCAKTGGSCLCESWVLAITSIFECACLPGSLAVPELSQEYGLLECHKMLMNGQQHWQDKAFNTKKTKEGGIGQGISGTESVKQ